MKRFFVKHHISKACVKLESSILLISIATLAVFGLCRSNFFLIKLYLLNLSSQSTVETAIEGAKLKNEEICILFGHPIRSQNLLSHVVNSSIPKGILHNLRKKDF